VDAVEPLRGEAPLIADTSAWWRVASLADDLDAILADRRARRLADPPRRPAVTDAAMAALGELAERSDDTTPCRSPSR
jgi:hypothetical protein